MISEESLDYAFCRIRDDMAAHQLADLIRYERADGVPLSATLYLPAGYQEGTRLPLLVWAYPLEYNDPGTAGQVRGAFTLKKKI